MTRPERRSSLARYTVALVATVAALLFRMALEPVIHGASPFVVFALAVMVSAWYGGLGPGLLATLAGAVLADYFLIQPQGFSRSPESLARIALFILVGSQISWLSGALRRANEQLEQRVRERTAELNFQKSLLESQSEASRDGIVAVSDDGRIIFSNERFEEMWDGAGRNGAGRVEDLRRRMTDRLVEPAGVDPLAVEAAWRGRAEEAGIEEMLLTGGRTLERYSAPIAASDGASFGRVWFFRDITERKRLERAVLEAGERERQRIGQDLHDDLCQQLSGIACLGRVLERNLASASLPDASRQAGEIAGLVQQATGRARDLAKGLHPASLTREGLDAALRDLCANTEAMFRVPCRFRGAGEVRVDDATVAAHLHRIAQEAIHNALRHARATRILVDIVAAPGPRLVMTVEDNGVGIPDELPGGGMGLHTMSFRARLIGALLTVERGDAGGTIVTCSLRPQTPDATTLAAPEETDATQSSTPDVAPGAGRDSA